MSQSTLSRILAALSIAAALAGYFTGYVQQHPRIEDAVVTAFILSEALAQVPYVKANSISEAIVSALAAVLRKLAGR